MYSDLVLYSLLLTVGILMPTVVVTQNPNSNWQKKADSLIEIEMYSQAEEVLLKAKAESKHNSNWSDLINCQNELARLYETIDPLQKAEQVNSALTIGEKYLAKTDTALGLTYMLKGELYLAEARWDSAGLWFDKAVETLGKKQDCENFLWAKQFQAVAHFYQGEYREVEPIILDILDLADTCLPSQHDIIPQCWQILGAYSEAVGDFEKGLLYGEQAMAYREGLPQKSFLDSLFLSGDYNNIGANLARKGAIKEAMGYYKQSLALRKALSGDNRVAIAQSLTNIADLYKEAGDLQEANLWFMRTLDTLGQSIDHESAITYISTCQNLSVCHTKLGNEPLGKQYAKSAIEVSHQFKQNAHLSFRALGEAFLAESNTDSAKWALKQSLELNSSKRGRKKGRVRALPEYVLGMVYLELQNYEEALRYFQSALSRLAGSFTDSTGLSNPLPNQFISRRLAVDILLGKARALQEWNRGGDMELALASLELAFELTAGLRDSYQAEGSKYFVTEKVKVLAEKIIALCLRLHGIQPQGGFWEKAYHYSERSRSILLLESILNSEAPLFALVPDSLLEKERSINRDLTFYQSRLAGRGKKTDSLKVKLWEDKVFSLLQNKKNLSQLFETTYPDYFNFRYHFEMADPNEIGQTLTGDEVVLEYFIGERALYCFVIHSDGFEVFSDSLPDDWDELLANYYQALSDHEFILTTPRKAWQVYTQNSTRFYQLLIPELAFQGKPFPKKLTIIPDGNLNYIPFETLLTHSIDGNASIDYLGLPYLLRKSVVNYAWSGSLLVRHPLRNKLESNRMCLAMAPEYNGSIQAPQKGALTVLRGEHAALPDTRKEIEAISSYFQGNYFLGNEATKSTFQTLAPDYSMIHLAMHSIPDLKNPMASRLIFSGSEGGEELEAWEIFNLRLSADLVVLSACETGYGKLVQGEGVMSLARGFLQAGASSVVTTLWKIEDQSSSAVMSNFYAGIGAGLAVDEALREAKLNFLKEADSRTAHPAYWAGFVSVGEATPVVGAPSSFRKWIWVGLGLILLIGLIYLLRQKRKLVRNK